jgi:hypothetical protein
MDNCMIHPETITALYLIALCSYTRLQESMMLFFKQDEPTVSSHPRKTLTYAENRPQTLESLVPSCNSLVECTVRGP